MKYKRKLVTRTECISLVGIVLFVLGAVGCLPSQTSELDGASTAKPGAYEAHNALYNSDVSSEEVTRNKNIIDDFYKDFSNKKGLEMGQVYSKKAVFNDAVFVGLDSSEVKAMWHMLTTSLAKSPVWGFSYEIISATGNRVTAKWTAKYAYSATGNTVINNVRSSFILRDGKVVSQIDRFDFGQWVKQAMGSVQGNLLNNRVGQGMIQKKAKDKLAAFMQDQ